MEEKVISTRMHAAADKAVKKLQDGSKQMINILDVEKQKAEVRSDIGHCSKDLSKAYEKLGRMYYAWKMESKEMEGEADMFDLIRSKEKIIELLNEKLERLDG